MDYRGDRPAGGFGPGVRGRVLDATLADLATQNLREQEYHDRMEDRERRRERRGSVSFEEERARMAQRQLQLATAGGAKDESIGSGAGIDASRGGGGGGGAGEATPSDEDGDEDGENDEDFDEDEDSFDEGDDGQLSRLMKSTIEQTLNSYRWAEGAEARAASDKSTRANRAGLERELHELKQSGQLDDALHAQFLRMIKEATGTKSKKIKDSGDGAAGGDARKKRGGASQVSRLLPPPPSVCSLLSHSLFSHVRLFSLLCIADGTRFGSVGGAKAGRQDAKRGASPAGNRRTRAPR